MYEGVRFGEIESATQGDVSCRLWVPGKLNTADWLTKVLSPKDLGPESTWYTMALMFSENLWKNWIHSKYALNI